MTPTTHHPSRHIHHRSRINRDLRRTNPPTSRLRTTDMLVTFLGRIVLFVVFFWSNSRVVWEYACLEEMFCGNGGGGSGVVWLVGCEVGLDEGKEGYVVVGVGNEVGSGCW